MEQQNKCPNCGVELYPPLFGWAICSNCGAKFIATKEIKSKESVEGEPYQFLI